MKRLREYLNEDFDPAIFNHDGGISIDDPTVVDALNSNLEMATAGSFRTPYNALEEVRKVLAYYKIFLPKSVFLDQTDGNDVFQISQFGEKTGMNDKGEVVTADDSSLFVYFEWSINEKGLYDTFACVCNQEELDDVLDDFESEVEKELQEEMSPAEVSKLMYKVKNAMMSNEHKALVKSYMAKAISEQQMPDLKKKMGAKKVTLPNMMRKEEKQSDWSKDMKKQRKYAEKKLTPKAKAARDAAAKETINEISHKLAKKAEHKSAKDYYDKYDAETKARGKYIKSKAPEDKAEADAAKEKRTKAAKRTIRFQQYADKKLKEETDKQTMIRYGMGPSKKKSDAPFDKPTEKPSTPYKNPKAKAKQLARAAMKKALADKKK